MGGGAGKGALEMEKTEILTSSDKQTDTGWAPQKGLQVLTRIRYTDREYDQGTAGGWHGGRTGLLNDHDPLYY